jgi:hypothetical protein
VIDEDAGARGLESQHHLLAGIDERQRAAAQRAGCCVEVVLGLINVSST